LENNMTEQYTVVADRDKGDDPTVQVPMALIYNALDAIRSGHDPALWPDVVQALDVLLSQPTPTAEPKSGRRWAEGVYAINFQPGYYPSIVMPDVDGWDLLYEDGTWYNPSEGDTLHRLDPSTIRDVMPPKEQP
jgi:hypothetical protein